MAEKKNGKKSPPRRVGGEKARKKINVLALIEALEQHVLGEKEMTATHRITLHYRADVTASMRIPKGAAVYNIVAVTDSGTAGIWLDILTVQASPA